MRGQLRCKRAAWRTLPAVTAWPTAPERVVDGAPRPRPGGVPAIRQELCNVSHPRTPSIGPRQSVRDARRPASRRRDGEGPQRGGEFLGAELRPGAEVANAASSSSGTSFEAKVLPRGAATSRPNWDTRLDACVNFFPRVGTPSPTPPLDDKNHVHGSRRR